MIKINCIILTVVFSGVSNIFWQNSLVFDLLSALYSFFHSLCTNYGSGYLGQTDVFIFLFIFFFVCGEIACHRDGIWFLSSTRTFNLNRNM